jgi:hypothetical protein
MMAGHHQCAKVPLLPEDMERAQLMLFPLVRWSGRSTDQSCLHIPLRGSSLRRRWSSYVNLWSLWAATKATSHSWSMTPGLISTPTARGSATPSSLLSCQTHLHQEHHATLCRGSRLERGMARCWFLTPIIMERVTSSWPRQTQHQGCSDVILLQRSAVCQNDGVH